MIAKISTGNYTLGMVKYNDDKTKEENINGKNAVLLGVNNIINDDFKTIVKTISEHNKVNENVSKPNIHISLNFHKDDVLDNNLIYKIASDYMENLGYSNQPYAIYRHFDKEHPHVHIVSSQIDEGGKKISDSFLYRKSQRISRELELKYNITIATEQQGNKIENKDIGTLINEHLEQGKHSLSGVLSRIILEALSQKPCSEKELDYALQQLNTRRTIYEEDGNKKGNYFHLLSFDQLSEPIIKDKGIKGSDIDTSFNYAAIQNQIDINAKTKEKNIKQVMGKVYSIVNKLPNEKELLSKFINDLQKKGIEVGTKRKQTGDDINSIYGLTFKDINTGIVYTATELKIKTKDLLDKIIDDGGKKENIISKKDENPTDSKNPDDQVNQDSIYGSSSLLEEFFKINSANVKDEQVSLAEDKKKRKRKRN